MQYKPHKYQSYAKQWIIDHPYCGLLLDMGLGKTIITLTALWDLILDDFEIGRVCIIGPKRVIEASWPQELSKWPHLTGLTYSVVAGTVKQRREALAKPAFLYLVSRDNVSWLIENGYWDFDALVIDELSSFKSPQAKRFKSLKRVRGSCKRIIGLTGTPGNPMDLWSQIFLLDGGKRLEAFITAYRNRYFIPDKRNREVIYSYKPKEGAEDLIYEKISDICISMKSVEYLEMPDLIMSNIEVTMNEEERKLYDQLKQDLILPLKDGDIDAKSAVGLSGKLQQMASGCVYDENGNVRVIHDKKMEVVEELIEAACGQPILIVYYFKFDKARLMERFGAQPVDTPEDILKWNRGEIPVGIFHSNSGFGLNLQQGGCHMIWLGPIWSLESYQQTNRRLYRQGQDKPVTIQHIVCKDTIDEDILAAIEKKDCTQEAILTAVKARLC